MGLGLEVKGVVTKLIFIIETIYAGMPLAEAAKLQISPAEFDSQFRCQDHSGLA